MEAKAALRYDLDFKVIPALIRNNPRNMIPRIRDRGARGMCSIYNSMWVALGNSTQFEPEQFTVRTVMDAEQTLLYITLPPTDPGAGMTCSNIAITYSAPDYADVRVFHVEHGSSGTHAIGEMNVCDESQDYTHINYGEAPGTDEAVIEKVCGLVF